MTYNFSEQEIKHQNSSFSQYIYHSKEPMENTLTSVSAERETKLLKHSHDMEEMRQGFRQIASRLRNHP